MEHCRCENSLRRRRHLFPRYYIETINLLIALTSFPSFLKHRIRSHPSSKRNVSIESYFGSTIMREQRRGMYISEDIETRIFISFAYLHKIISCNLIFINIYSKKHSISRLLLPSDNKNSKYSIDILLNLKLFTF